MAETTIRSDLIRGSIDAMLLRVLSAHDSYGYEIIKTITQRTGGRYELKEPSLYTSLQAARARRLCAELLGRRLAGGAPEVLPHYAGGRGAAARRGGAVARGAGHH